MADQSASKLELEKLIETTEAQHDLCASGVPHLHMAFFLRTMIQALPDNFTPQERWEKLRAKILEVTGMINGEAILVSGSAAEGLFIPQTLINHDDGTYVQEAADIDVMLVNETLHVKNKPAFDSKPCVIFDPSCCHHGYTRIRVIGELPNQTAQIEKLDSEVYVSNQQLFSLTNDRIRESFTAIGKDAEIAEELGIEGESTKRRQGPALTGEGLFYMWKKTVEIRLDVDTVPALKADWPKEARVWKLRSMKTKWPPVELMDKVIADGCHVVPVPHASSKCSSIEWRLSFSKAEVMLAHSLTTFQRSCYRFFKLICSIGISPKKVIATYFLKTTFFWLCEEKPESFWQMHNVSFILIALIDKLIFFLSKGGLPNFFVPANNMVDHILPEKLKIALQSIVKIRGNPVKYLMMFSSKSIFAKFGIPWHVAFKPAVNDIPVSLKHSFLLRTVGAFNQSLRRFAGLQITVCSYKEALHSLNSSADITELCRQQHISHRLAFAANNSINLAAHLPPETVFTNLHSIIDFHRHLLTLVSMDSEKAAISYSLGYVYLILSHLPAPVYSKSFQPVVDTLQTVQGNFYKERFLNHKVLHLKQAQGLFETAKSLTDAADLVGNPIGNAEILPSHLAVSCRLAQVLLMLGNPTEAAEYLQGVIRDPYDSQSEITMFWYEKGLYDVGFIMTSVLGVPKEYDSANSDGKSVGVQADGVHADDKQNISFSDRSYFSKRLQDELFIGMRCNVFARYLLVLVKLLEEQKSKISGYNFDIPGQTPAKVELIQLERLCHLQSDRPKQLSIAMFKDCCLIEKMFHSSHEIE